MSSLYSRGYKVNENKGLAHAIKWLLALGQAALLFPGVVALLRRRLLMLNTSVYIKSSHRLAAGAD